MTGTPPNPPQAPKLGPGGLPMSLRRALRAWLALELSAAILAYILLVALLPLIAIALPAYLGLAVPPWADWVDVLAVSVPLAVLLGASALRLPLEVARVVEQADG